MPHWVRPTVVLLLTLSLLPLALIARARATRSASPRIHIIQDMDNQGRYKSQQPNALFADRRAMRTPVTGTVARGMLRLDDRLYRGVDGDGYATTFPIDVTLETLQRGQERYGIYCAPCHGLSGNGDGMVSQRAIELQSPAWVPPASLHEAPAAGRELGHYFNTITNGIRNMPAYGSQISAEDRWAIVTYIKALQRTRTASVAQLSADERRQVEASDARR